jgi:PAS domain S-box-containing protein
MASELRNTGISIIREVPWGTHFCHFYETKQDLLDTLVPYFKTGLESNEFCMWVVSNTDLITTEEAKAALAKVVSDLERHLSEKNIEILSAAEWYLEQNVFNLRRVTNGWEARLKRALERGYDGMRVSGDTGWLTEKAWKDFNAYEKQLNDSTTNQDIIVLCTYPLAKSGAAEVLDVVQAHQFATARRNGEWQVVQTPELREAQAEIKRLNEELEQRVDERTRQLIATNEALRSEIIERERVEEELRARAADLAEAQRVGNIGNWILNVRTNEVTWSDELYRIFEIEKGDFDGLYESFVSRVHAEDQERVLTTNTEARTEGLPFDIEYRIVTSDSRVKIIREVGYATHDEAGQIIRLFGTAQDITGRKLVEWALDERLRFETLLSELSAAFANLSPNAVDHEIDKWLQTLVEFLGLDRASFLQFEEDWTTLYRSHSFTAAGITQPTPPPIVVKDQLPWITDQLRQGVTVKWARVPDDMPEEAAKEKEYAARLGIKSGLNIPVRIGGSVICAIAFTSITTYRDWPDAMVARLRLVGEIFAGAIERKRSEEALRASEEQFRQLAENIREVFWLATADLSKMLYISPAYEAVWGRSRESLYRESPSFFAAIHDEDRPRVVGIVERDREQGFEVEYRVVRPDGSIRWIRDRGFPIRDDSGHFYRVAGIAEDITDREQAEAELKQRQNQLAEAQRLAHLGSWSWTLKTDTFSWSDELYRILGVEPQSFTPVYESFVRRFVHPEDRALMKRIVEDCLKTREPFSFYYRVLRPDGDERIIHARGNIISDELGDPVRMFGTALDVTERKQAEEKLKATTEQMRALSARIHSAKEEESARIARELHDELGSTLTSLKWGLDELDGILLSGEIMPDIDKLREKISSMITLTDSTLNTVRRISSELRPSILDDVGLTAAIRWQTRRFETRTGIVCNFSAFDAIDLTREQSTAVFRIFQEALTNVARHAQATEVEISLKEEAEQFVLTISDNGRGIKPTEPSGAESLGLVGMRERAHLVRGEVSINGSRGRGTVVVVRIPVAGQSQVRELIH